MPDELTQAERAAIAAYKGPITRIPRGVAGQDALERAMGLHWREHNERNRRQFSRMRQFQALKAREEREAVENISEAAKIAIRRDAVLRMSLEGKLHTEMADALGVSLYTIGKDVRVMREAGEYITPEQRTAALRKAGRCA